MDMTVPAKHEVQVSNGLRYVVDPIERPIEAQKQGWGDCAIKAMALALNRTYLDVLTEVVEHQKRHVHGGRNRWTRGTNDATIRKIMGDAGWTYVAERRNLTSATALARLPRRAVLDFTDHVAYIENGVIYDGFVTHRAKRQTIGWYIPPFKAVTIEQALSRKPELRRNLIQSYRVEREMLPSFEQDTWDEIVREDLTAEEFDLYMQKYRRAS